MTLIQGHGCLCQKQLFVALSDSSLPPKSEFSEQPIGLLGIKLFVSIIPAIAIDIPK